MWFAWLYLWSAAAWSPQRFFGIEGQKPNEGIDQDTPEIANVNEEEDEEGPPDINPDEGLYIESHHHHAKELHIDCRVRRAQLWSRMEGAFPRLGNRLQ